MSKEEERKGKAEKVAGKASETVGEGIKKGFGVVKAFGKGAKEGITEKKKEEK